jgi:hypothetical protein
MLLWIVLLALVAIPFALILGTSFAERYQELSPEGSARTVQALFAIVFDVAIIGALLKTKAGEVVAIAMVGGWAAGMWVGAGLLVMAFMLLLGLPALSLILLIFDGWPYGWPGRALGMVLGGAAGSVHGYCSASLAMVFADYDE